ncbi:MAG: response regulator [Alphaproteobacteria bacterium]|nr:response regulator [Alphaproteobacteria bacterium]
MTVRTRILVVEDEGITAWDIEHSLIDLGFEVVGVADTAEEAVDMARANHPDLVLMDVHLKGPQDGITAAGRIRDELRLPVIYLTAHRDGTTLERAKATEPFAYLLKPFHRQELQTAVEVALQRHHLERSLRERERLFSTTLRCIRDGVVTTDATGRVTLLNPTAETLTGWEETEARGRPVERVLELMDDRSNEPRDNGVATALGGTEPDPIAAARVVGRDGREFLVSTTVARVVDGDHLLGTVAVMHDIERERQLRQQLEHAERLATFGTMAAGVAHEINNPLAFVVGNLHYAIESLSADGRSLDEVQALEDALDGAQRISKIVEDFRSFGRATPASREPVRLADVIRYAITVTEANRRRRFEVEVEVEGDPVVYGDEARLGQVLVNLLVNATHAMEVDQRFAPITVRAGHDGETWVFVEVVDRGCGMSDEQLKRAFEPFYTTKPQGKGTGLGLSVAHGIVEAHGGAVQVRTRTGHGSTFRVTLPAHEPRPTRTPAPAPTRGRVLLVDDEPALLRSLQRVLARRHDVQTAGSADEALRIIEEGARFDLVLCDVQMPRMSGLDLLARLTERHPDVARRVTLITGGLLSTGDLGPDGPGLLKKPFDPRQILDTVDQLVAEAARQG